MRFLKKIEIKYKLFYRCHKKLKKKCCTYKYFWNMKGKRNTRISQNCCIYKQLSLKFPVISKVLKCFFRSSWKHLAQKSISVLKGFFGHNNAFKLCKKAHLYVVFIFGFLRVSLNTDSEDRYFYFYWKFDSSVYHT